MEFTVSFFKVTVRLVIVGFHLGADQLGFMGGTLNLVPGNKFLNNSDYKKLENNLAALNKNHTVHVEFKAVYNLGNTNSRPDGFKVEYTLENEAPKFREFTNTGERIKK